MKAPIKQSDFPRYFFNDKVLYAFKGPAEMFKIEPKGSNTNEGVTIDYYKTRAMVLKHWPFHTKEISKEYFEKLVKKLFDNYIDKVVN